MMDTQRGRLGEHCPITHTGLSTLQDCLPVQIHIDSISKRREREGKSVRLRERERKRVEKSRGEQVEGRQTERVR
jgi:hypothetical protein